MMNTTKKTKLEKNGSQYFYKNFPVLSLPDEGRTVKYFSLNPFLPDDKNRCPLECTYCICHDDGEWHHHPELFDKLSTPSDLANECINIISQTNEGKNGFPISICDYSDPFILPHQDRVIELIHRIATVSPTIHNMIYLTTKYHPGIKYLMKLKEVLSHYPNLKPTIFVSLPPLKPGYEPVSIGKRIQLIKDLVSLGIPCCWYLRPLTQEWYDEGLMWYLARELMPHVSDHVILSGVVMTQAIETQLRQHNLDVPAWSPDQSGKKQLLKSDFEQHLRHILDTVSKEKETSPGPVMSHRLCGTNGNHAYGCMVCGKSDRYCQLFQVHHYGGTIKNANKQSAIPIENIDENKEK